MPAQMVDPADMQLKPLPTVLALTDGRSFQGDADQSIGVQAGWLIPIYAAPVADGFKRTSSAWVPQGDGTALEVVTDVSQASIDAANAAAQEAQQAAQQAAAVAQAQANAEALQAAQASYTAAVAQVTPLAQQYRALLRAYFGANAETNRDVTAASVMLHFAAIDASQAITAQQAADGALLQTLFQVLAPLAGDPTVGAQNTWSSSFWALIP